MPSRRGRGRQTGRMARTGTSLVPFEKAVDATRTGDLWIFRGGTVADRVIQTASNSPVNHVGMAVVLEDLPPLMWHAELGRSLRDTGPAATTAGSSCTTCATPSRVWA